MSDIFLCYANSDKSLLESFQYPMPLLKVVISMLWHIRVHYEVPYTRAIIVI